MPKKIYSRKSQVVKSRTYEIFNSEGRVFMAMTTRVSSRREAREQAMEDVARWNRYKPGHSYRLIE
jgi:hypothetical protein